MAKHIVSENMEFFYNEIFSFDLLLKELSGRFSYQKVCFVGFDQDFKQKIEERKDILFFPDFLNETTNEINLDIACMVCYNEENFKICNKICNEITMSLVLYIDTYFNISNLCLNGDARLLGIVMDKSKIEKDSKKFVLNFLFNISEIVFYVSENKINNIYFNQPINKKIEKISEKIENFINLLQKNAIFYNFDTVMEYYFDLINLFFNERKNIQFFISNALTSTNFDNFILSQMLFNIYLNFCQNINPNLVDYPSLSVEDYSKTENLLFFNKNFENKKFWFIYERFNLSVQNLINTSLGFIQKIKDLCNEICINEMFNLATKSKIFEIKNKLQNIVIDYPEDSILKVICNYGLLNFEKNKEKSA